MSLDHLAFPDDKTVFATSAADFISGNDDGLRVGVDSVTQEFLYYVDPITGVPVGDVPDTSNTTATILFDIFTLGIGLLFPPPAFAPGATEFIVPAINNTAVDYAFSTAAINVDLQRGTQQGGFAEGDVLTNVFEVSGTLFNDIIRGDDLQQGIINDPGDNVLNGRGGNDVLEGRGGGDTLNGGDGSDFASYESSNAAVRVTLAGVGSDTQVAVASGGDAAGDVLSSIENLIGSRFGDTLIGNSLNNILTGGGGNDTLDGKDGADTADYSFTHIFDSDDIGNHVVVALGLNGAAGTASEFKFFRGDIIPTLVSTDTLISIENVIGTNGADTFSGNEKDNVLDGRNGGDTLDGGLGNDTLIGGSGIDTATYVSHDGTPVLTGELDFISLGLGTADGSYTRAKLVSVFPLQIQVVESDVLRGIENITGSNHDESITGNEQANILSGRGGADVLDGGLGNDSLIGGGGVDTASYLSHDSLPTQAGELDIINLGLGTYIRSQPVSTFETDSISGIENVTGSNHDETIIGNDQANVLDGRGGNDILDGALGNDTIIGGSGVDTAGYNSHDAINTPGVTVTLGAGSADGSAIAVIINPNGQVTVETDVLRGIENVAGSIHNDTLNGNERDNVFVGHGGIDVLNGGGGGDAYDFSDQLPFSSRIFDDSGTDALFVKSFDGIVANKSGNDLIVTLPTGTVRIVDHFNGHAVENIQNADGVSMVLATGNIGGNAPGIIAGGNGGETLDGRGGNDFLFGGNGKDRLIGGDGDDRLTGGHGPDTFVFGPGFGHDIVTDFSHADSIEFDGGVFRNVHDVLAATQQVGDDTVITVDANNSITLQGVSVHSLHASDVLFG